MRLNRFRFAYPVGWIAALLLSGCDAGQADPDRDLAGHGVAQGLSTAAKGPPIEIVGKLRVAVVDDFEAGSSWLEMELHDGQSGETYQLWGVDEEQLPATLRDGATVRVRGYRGHGREVEVPLDPRGGTHERGSIEVLSLPAAQAVTGSRNTLVLVADFVDLPVTCSTSDIEASMFGSGPSAGDLFDEMTFGQLAFSGTVVGPFTISASSTDACDAWGWARKADREAKRRGYDPAVYDNVMYVFPRGTCSYAGVAHLGGRQAINTGYCHYEDVYAHELGHNLGLHHASTPNLEYGDPSDVMGGANDRLEQVNAPHRVQMGWIDPSMVVDVRTSGVFTVAPLELDHVSAGALPQVLRVRKADTNEDYFLSYRQSIGYDINLCINQSGNCGWVNALSIHRHAGTAQTYFETVVFDGNTWVDSANGISVTLLTHDATGATVQLGLTGDTQPPTPPGDLTGRASKSGRSYRVLLDWTASTDNVAVTGYEIWRDGAPLGTTSTLSYADPGVARGGTYTYAVHATDAAGNVSGGSVITVVVP